MKGLKESRSELDNSFSLLKLKLDSYHKSYLSRLVYCIQSGVPSSCRENRSSPRSLFCFQKQTHSSHRHRPVPQNCPVAAFYRSPSPTFQIPIGCSLSSSSRPLCLDLLLRSRLYRGFAPVVIYEYLMRYDSNSLTF